MKAVLVIDIDANELPKDAYANIYVFGKYYEEQEDDFVACIGDVPLKPMPNQWIPQLNGLDIEQQIRNIDFAGGWNACLDKITGETE